MINKQLFNSLAVRNPEEAAGHKKRSGIQYAAAFFVI
jgi:hypothetical protein